MTATARNDKMLIYRLELSQAPATLPLSTGTFVLVHDKNGVFENFRTWVTTWGFAEAVKMAFKVLSKRRIFFGVVFGKAVVQSGWANLGFCRHYPVGPHAVVLGTLWTQPELRGKGLATAALRRTLASLFQKGYRSFYIDADAANTASRRMIEKTGFLERVP